MEELPSGTVTFLLTDIEGSTARRCAPGALAAALARRVTLGVTSHQSMRRP